MQNDENDAWYDRRISKIKSWCTHPLVMNPDIDSLVHYVGFLGCTLTEYRFFDVNAIT